MSEEPMLSRPAYSWGFRVVHGDAVGHGLRDGDVLVYHPSMEGLEFAVYRYVPVDQEHFYDLVKNGDLKALNGDQRLPTFRRLHKEVTSGLTPVRVRVSHG
jgi:hypothetical protein